MIHILNLDKDTLARQVQIGQQVNESPRLTAEVQKYICDLNLPSWFENYFPKSKWKKTCESSNWRKKNEEEIRESIKPYKKIKRKKCRKKSLSIRTIWPVSPSVKVAHFLNTNILWQKMSRWISRMTKHLQTVSGNVQNARTRIRKSTFSGVQDMSTTEKARIWKVTQIYVIISKKCLSKDVMKRNSEEIWLSSCTGLAFVPPGGWRMSWARQLYRLSVWRQTR